MDPIEARKRKLMEQLKRKRQKTQTGANPVPATPRPAPKPAPAPPPEDDDDIDDELLDEDLLESAEDVFDEDLLESRDLEDVDDLLESQDLREMDAEFSGSGGYGDVEAAVRAAFIADDGLGSNLAAAGPALEWESVASTTEAASEIARARIPGGWLVLAVGTGGLTFVPDVMFKWRIV